MVPLEVWRAELARRGLPELDYSACPFEPTQPRTASAYRAWIAAHPEDRPADSQLGLDL